MLLRVLPQLVIVLSLNDVTADAVDPLHELSVSPCPNALGIRHSVGMDAATVRAMLEQHFATSDPDLSHAMYHDDAVLEFPQSGERFVGVENLREWRSNYPERTVVEFREIRGRDDLWVAEISISYEGGPWNFGVSILEFRGEKIARESIYVAEGWEPPEWRAGWRSAP